MKKLLKIIRHNRQNFIVYSQKLSAKDEEVELKKTIEKYLQESLKTNRRLFSLTLNQSNIEPNAKIAQWPKCSLSEFSKNEFDVIYLFLKPNNEYIPNQKLLTQYNTRDISKFTVLIIQTSETKSKLVA